MFPETARTQAATLGAVPRDIEEQAAMIALLEGSPLRWSEVAHEVLDRGSALAVLNNPGSTPQTEALFSVEDAQENDLVEARRKLVEWQEQGITVLTVLDPMYPAQLKDILQVPPVVFSRGTLARDRRAIAVVGTRDASPTGVRLAGRVATVLSENNVTVVSGLAAGIDSSAHQAALRAGGRTVAVLGTGINRYYPKENKALQDTIAEQGLLLSQFWPDAPPSRKSFPMRNAIMSGYSAATVVIEAPARSGARTQARLALEHGRPVVMPKQLLKNEWAGSDAQTTTEK